MRHVIAMACTRTGSKLAEWLYALPLLHFLNSDIMPFQIPAGADEMSLRWWGLEELKNEIDTFLKQTPLRLVFIGFM